MKHVVFIVCLSMFSIATGAGQTGPGPAQQNPSPSQSNPVPATGPEAQQGQSPSPDAPGPEQPAPAESADASQYNKAIFQNPIPSEQLSFINRFAGATSGEVVRDRQFHKLMQHLLPDCMFHYGHDMPLLEAMDTVLHDSREQVEIRDGRYFVVSGHSGPYLLGRGFLWIDLQDGIALGGFYFHPTNGEPTPAVNIFSSQVKEEYLAMSELPPAFADELSRWSDESRVPPITTRYFINGAKRKILLEHDEDYCARMDGGAAPEGCEQMNSDAADIDMDAANYLEQTHHATNATAWMITGQEQKVWLQVRVRTCGDLLPCRVRLTRERVHVIIHRPPRPHITRSVPSTRPVRH
ncbi:MAG TPA: hypothetical protein VKW06_21395 [Candidatus Angelobacter sp.]|nr:hypothetical protein [Candidatus Angelobacter sp.]